MYRATVQVRRTHSTPVNWHLNAPPGFHLNAGPRYIPCPVRIGGVTRQAKYIQVIMGPNPMVLGEVQALKLGSIRRMEMADVIARLEERQEGMLDYRELWQDVRRGCPT